MEYIGNSSLHTLVHPAGVSKDVSRFVKECHPCQVAGKPNQPVPVSPLKPIPVMQNSFERIIVDIVGSLPKTSSGYSYLLTILDVATRYPEAIPLRTIHAKVVVRELLCD